MNQTWENDKKNNFGPDFGSFGPKLRPQNLFSCLLLLLDVRHCSKLSLYALSRKTYDPSLRKYLKTSFWAWFKFFYFKILGSSFTRYHGKLSSCTIPEKTNDSILRKFSDVPKNEETDWRTDRRTDRRMSVIS